MQTVWAPEAGIDLKPSELAVKSSLRWALQSCLEEVQHSSPASGTRWGHLSCAPPAEDRGQNVIKCLSLTIYLPMPSQLRFPVGKFIHNNEINPVTEGLGSSLKRKQN